MSNQLAVSKKIDGIVLSVIGKKGLSGFEKAFTVSSAILELETILDEQYMKPIMALQGTSLGFKTDKDLVKNPNGYGYVKGTGYPVEVVRKCLIEAVLKGLQPTNNEFNIIGGNMYPAKNGLERLANEFEGLKKSIIQTIKAFDIDKGSALVEAKIKWNINGIENEEIIPIPLKIDKFTSVDAVLGKSKRKALAWLLSNITGEVVVDGDVDDVTFEELKSEKKVVKKLEEIDDLTLDLCIQNGWTLEQLQEKYTLTDAQIQKLSSNK